MLPILDGQFASTIHQIAHDFTPPAVQNQYVIQGMGGRRWVAEDESFHWRRQVQ